MNCNDWRRELDLSLLLLLIPSQDHKSKQAEFTAIIATTLQWIWPWTLPALTKGPERVSEAGAATGQVHGVNHCSSFALFILPLSSTSSSQAGRVQSERHCNYSRRELYLLRLGKLKVLTQYPQIAEGNCLWVRRWHAAGVFDIIKNMVYISKELVPTRFPSNKVRTRIFIEAQIN